MERLDRRVMLGFIVTLAIFMMTTVYWATDPGRRNTAADNVLKASTHRGLILYVDNCLTCHGEQGKGSTGTGAPKSLVDSQLSEDEMITVVTRGRSGTNMAAFGDQEGGALKSTEVQDLVNFIRSFNVQAVYARETAIIEMTPEPTPTPEGFVAPTPEPGDPVKGKQIFTDRQCRSCHGADATAQETTPALACTILTQEDVIAQARNPRIRTPDGTMPPQPPSKVTDQDLIHIYAWLQSLCP